MHKSAATFPQIDQPLSQTESLNPIDGSHPERERGVAKMWFFVIVAEVAIFLPLMSGTVLFLDYSDYPAGQHSSLGAYAWGFPPGLTSRAPVNALLIGLFRLFPWGPLKLLPLLLVLPLAAWGFFRLFDRRLLATIAATLLFVVNPFVYERMVAGQAYFVLGYALLPLFLSLLVSRSEGVAAPIVAGLLFSLLMALSPHFAFLGGLVLLVSVGLSLRRGGRSQTFCRAGITLLVTVLASLYWIIPIATQASKLEG